MKLLLDECVDWRFGRALVDHEVKSAQDMGWASIKNGQLLKLAESQFDVLITVDANLSFQNKINNLDIALVVLHVVHNKLPLLLPLVPELLDALMHIQPGQTVHLGGTEPFYE